MTPIQSIQYNTPSSPEKYESEQYNTDIQKANVIIIAEQAKNLLLNFEKQFPCINNYLLLSTFAFKSSYSGDSRQIDEFIHSYLYSCLAYIYLDLFLKATNNSIEESQSEKIATQVYENVRYIKGKGHIKGKMHPPFVSPVKGLEKHQFYIKDILWQCLRLFSVPYKTFFEKEGSKALIDVSQLLYTLQRYWRGDSTKENVQFYLEVEQLRRVIDCIEENYTTKEATRLKEETSRLAQEKAQQIETKLLKCIERQVPKEIIINLPNYADATIEQKLRYIHEAKNFKLEQLYLNEVIWGEIPIKYYYLFNQLKELNLSHNDLHRCSFLDGIAPYLLTILDISNNHINDLPGSFNQLYKLEVLNLSYNSLKTFPKMIHQLCLLRFLDISNNELENFSNDSFNNLRLLEVLNLSHNQLKEVPENLWNSNSLKSVDISNNKLISLSENIKKCAQLESLYLSSNELKSSLPEEVWQCSSLKRLDLSNNQLEQLPKGINNCSHLIQLYLSNNLLKTLPEDITKCAQLKKIYIISNPFFSIDKKTFLTLKENKIKIYL